MKKNIKFDICLTKKDKNILRMFFKKGNLPVRVIKRIQVLLNADQGMNASDCANLLRITENTVRNIGKRYQQSNLDTALYDKPRPGQPNLLNPKQEQTLIAMVCSNPPEGRARWTIQLIQEEVIRKKIIPFIGLETVRLILQNHELKPWQKKMWCIPNLNEEYIQRMEDVLDLYEKPYNRLEPLICLDEKPIQLLDSNRVDTSPVEPGKIKKIDYEYRRCGTANVFCGIETKTGKHFIVPTSNRTAPEFAKMIASIETFYHDANKIHLVLDNLNTHCEKSLIKYFGNEKGQKIWERFQIHYTPKHASWLNQAEIEIGIYSKQCLGFRRIKSLTELKYISRKWSKQANKEKLKINWKFTSKMAKEKFKY